jgi:protein TonB
LPRHGERLLGLEKEVVKPVSKNKPNWLFRALIIISVGIHAFIFVHISGLYRSKALSFIELTLQDVSKPVIRNIPRPRFRPKEPPEIKNIERLKVNQRPIPTMKPLKLEPAEKNLPDSVVEKIVLPKVPAVSNPSIEHWVPPEIVKQPEPEDVMKPGDYLEMVKLKIEGQKRYPEQARKSQIEGRVTVGFIITPEGDIKEVRIAKKSRSRLLDEAAVKAVKDAAPFPRPPGRFFKGDIPLVITVVFELT